MLFASSPVLAATCSVSATPLSFGTVQGIAQTTRSSTATLSVTCQAQIATTVSYSLIYEAAGPASARTLTNGAAQVQYQLYTSNSDAQPWSDSHPISDRYSVAAGSSVTRRYTVYAKIQPGRNGAPGTYMDVGQVRLVY